MNALYLWVRGRLLRFLCLPPEPEPPAGAPGSLRVFRAGHNYYRLRFWIWVTKQVIAVVGFIIMLGFIHLMLRSGLDQLRQKAESRGRQREVATLNAVEHYSWLLPTLECLGFAFALGQMPFTYALIRLDYEQHWYLVTDRSLRIRTGIWNVSEMTLSFANIQQTSLHQGPLQRLLGLADLVVSTAGGGGASQAQPGVVPASWHTGVLRAVDNAEEIRDIIQERLRQLRSAGTGDADDPEGCDAAAPATLPEIANPRAAARELLEEVRQLRRVL